MTQKLEGRELDAAIAERCFGWQWWAFRRLDNLEYESYILPPRNMLTGHTNTYIAIAGCSSNKEQPRAPLWFAYGGQVVERENLPEFSTNMGDAWQVAEWIREHSVNKSFMLLYDTETEGIPNCWECTCWVWLGDSLQAVSAYADTPAEAICRAALKLADQLKKEQEK